MLRSRSPVHALGPTHHDAVLEVCSRDPVAHVFVAARIEEGALRDSPGTLLGLTDPDHRGRLSSIVWAGANLVPVEVGSAQLAPLAARLRRRARHVSSVFGPREQVVDLWSHLEPTWGRPRAVRASQPVMVTRSRPSELGLEIDERVRPARMAEVDAVVPAAAAMFTEEIGYPPYVGSAAAYRRSVASLVAQGRTYVVVERGEVVFKADVGSVALGVAQVQGVWLAPVLRGRGLAAPAMASVLELVLDTTAPTVCLYVNDFNARARATYARVGMVQQGEFSTVLL